MKERNCNIYVYLEILSKDKNVMLYFNLQVSPLEGNGYSRWIIQEMI